MSCVLSSWLGPVMVFFFLALFYKKMKNLESSQLMISSNVAVKSHRAGVVWNG